MIMCVQNCSSHIGWFDKECKLGKQLDTDITKEDTIDIS